MSVNSVTNNAIVIHSSESINAAIIECEKNNLFKVCTWIVHSNSEKEDLIKKFSDTLFLNNYDIIRLKRLENLDEKSQVEKELLDFFDKHLSIIVDMMGRFETYKHFSHSDKTTYIYNQLYYWYKYILENKIDLYIQFDTPHDVYDYIIYLIFKYFKKKIIIFNHHNFYHKNINNKLQRLLIATPISDLDSRECLLNDDEPLLEINSVSSLTNSYNGLEKENAIEELKNLIKPINLNIIQKTILWASLFKNIIFQKTYTNNYSTDEIGKIDKKITYFNFHLSRQLIHFKTKKLLNYYKSKSIKKIDKNRQFIFFPLHYQPERSTCPDGMEYSNQYLLLRLIRDYLDKDISILIKEHPRQFTMNSARNQSYRSEFFYKELLAQKNVYFIDQNFSIKDILFHPKLEGVLTVRGNIMLEAFFNDIPSFAIGKSIWKELPYVYDCNNVENLININSLIKSKNKGIPSDSVKLEKMNLLMRKGFLSEQFLFKLKENELKRFNNYFQKLIKSILN